MLAVDPTHNMEVLEHNLGSLDLSVPTVEPGLPDIQSNPLNLLRTYLAHILADITGCDVDAAYKSIQWPNNIFSGDLAVIIPKLRPGVKAETVAFELMEKVS